MTKWIHLALLLGLVSPVTAAVDYDSISNERRLATIEEQHINQENYNREFDRMINGKIDKGQSEIEQRFTAIRSDQVSRDQKLESLRDTQTIALFVAGATPILLGWAQAWFYFSKGRADRKRAAGITALENHVGIKTPEA